MPIKIMQLSFLKKNGISVLVSCQDDHVTLRDCVESFLLFGDEIIIITNRATDATLNLARRLSSEYPLVVNHVDAENASDLYQNRQAGLANSRYRWVMRCDADYIAYSDEDGERSIVNLRKRILNINAFWPVAVYMTKVSLSMGWDCMYEPADNEPDLLKYIPSVFTNKKEARIYSQNPFLRFTRLGRWEGVPWIKWYRKVEINEPFWFEVTIRENMSLLYRKARTDWRQLGDYNKYPELDDYVRNVFVPRDYPGLTVEQACEQYVNQEVIPKIRPYDEERYFPLPNRIKNKLVIQ